MDLWGRPTDPPVGGGWTLDLSGVSVGPVSTLCVDTVSLSISAAAIALTTAAVSVAAAALAQPAAVLCARSVPGPALHLERCHL